MKEFQGFLLLITTILLAGVVAVGLWKRSHAAPAPPELATELQTYDVSRKGHDPVRIKAEWFDLSAAWTATSPRCVFLYVSRGSDGRQMVGSICGEELQVVRVDPSAEAAQ